MFKRHFKYVAAIFAATFVFAVSFFQISHAANEAPLDVRIVIDISGSMKETDPENLRKTAVNMLAQMIPEGSKAGVWTFASYTNMLVKHREVDGDWKADANDASNAINAVGAWTNIGRALETVTWDRSRTQANTHVIFLTDGKVDLSRDDAADERERERILTELLPELKDKKYKFHTIALSDLADKDFLKELSYTTNGHYTVAKDSNSLIDSFLKSFDQAVPSNQVPITGNKFDIDESVKEFTVLAFKKSNNAPTKLILPSGLEFSEADHPSHVNWFSDDRFDLITIGKPMDGEWEIVADIDPDNRVTVVSDLVLQMTKLPAVMLDGEAIEIVATLTENDQNIEDKSFLNIVEMRLTHTLPNEQANTRPMRKLKAYEKSQYKYMFGRLQQEGIHKVHVIADGKTFKRQNVQQVNFIKPAEVKIFDLTKREGKLAGLKVKASDTGIDKKSLVVTAELKTPDGKTQNHPIEIAKDFTWTKEFQPDMGPGEYELTVEVKGLTQSGKQFTTSSPTKKLYVGGEAAVADQPVKSDAPVTENEVASPDAADKAPSEPVEEGKGIPQEEVDVVEELEEVLDDSEPEITDNEIEQLLADGPIDEAVEELDIEEVVIEEEQVLPEDEAVAEDVTELAEDEAPQEESDGLMDYILYGAGLMGILAIAAIGGILFSKRKGLSEEDEINLFEEEAENDSDIRALDKEMDGDIALDDPYLQENLEAEESGAADAPAAEAEGGLDIDNNIDQMLEAATAENEPAEEASEENADEGVMGEEPSWEEAFSESEEALDAATEAAEPEVAVEETAEEEPSWEDAFSEESDIEGNGVEEPDLTEEPAVAEPALTELEAEDTLADETPTETAEEEPSWDDAFGEEAATEDVEAESTEQPVPEDAPVSEEEPTWDEAFDESEPVSDETVDEPSWDEAFEEAESSDESKEPTALDKQAQQDATPDDDEEKK